MSPEVSHDLRFPHGKVSSAHTLRFPSNEPSRYLVVLISGVPRQDILSVYPRLDRLTREVE